MKKLLSLILAAVMVVSLAACGFEEAVPAEKAVEPEEIAFTPVVSAIAETQEAAIESLPEPEPVEIYIEPDITLSTDSPIQGDVIAVRVEMNSEEGEPEIETDLGDAYFLPVESEYDEGHAYMAYVPVWYAQEPGDYKMAVTAGEYSESFPISVGPAEFGEQHMTISSSTVASTTGADADADYAEKVKSQFTTHDDEKYWDGLFIQPVEARVSTEFGLFRYTNGSSSARRHTGIDLAAAAGTPVPASNRGKVVFAGEVIMTGNTVIIEHGGGLKTYYLHMSEIDCEEGQIVEKGDIIGLVGSTGYSTGAHLHFEVRIGSYAVNPWRLFDGSSTIYQWEDIEMPRTEETENAEGIESTEDAAAIEVTESTEGTANEN